MVLGTVFLLIGERYETYWIHGEINGDFNFPNPMFYENYNGNYFPTTSLNV